jgi:putative membrane protein
MGNGMMGCAGGLGMMGTGLLLFILLLVVIGYVAYRLGQNKSQASGAGGSSVGQSRGDEALEVVRHRYAQGEIDREQYERLRRDLA